MIQYPSCPLYCTAEASEEAEAAAAFSSSDLEKEFRFHFKERGEGEGVGLSFFPLSPSAIRRLLLVKDSLVGNFMELEIFRDMASYVENQYFVEGYKNYLFLNQN